MSIMPLEERALHNFDNLVQRGELLWTDTAATLIKDNLCSPQFEFRVAPAYKQKPILPADDKGRSEPTDPFGDDDPAFVICYVSNTHTLRLNKFCVVRPQFVLHTTQFERQSVSLALSDFLALWQALSKLGREKYAGIYNCGAQAGSSIGHKHMQIFPRSHRALFPDGLIPALQDFGDADQILKHADVLFEHAILPVARETTAHAIHSSYQKLCDYLKLTSESPHNVFMTNTWIIVVPRSKAKLGEMAANAASMLGMVWVKNDTELQAWRNYDPMNVLVDVGVKRETC